MLNNASKFVLGVAGLAVIAAIFADDTAAKIVLVAVILAAAIVAYGLARSVGSDLAPFAATDEAPASSAVDPDDVGRASYGPMVLAAGATIALAGGAVGPYYVLSGAIVALVGAVVWAFDNYRTPGVLAARDAANVNHRLLGPLALPVFSFLLAITIAYSFSRVLLAINETASWVLAFIVAAVVLTILTFVANRNLSPRVVAGVAGIGLVAVLAAGGAGAGAGEREFHDHRDLPPTQAITAQNIQFDRKVIGLPADEDVQIVFTNYDVGTFHNVAVYTEGAPGTPLFNGKPIAKGSTTYKVHTPAAGTYRYVCDFHPAMVGELRVTPSTATSKESEHE